MGTLFRWRQRRTRLVPLVALDILLDLDIDRTIPERRVDLAIDFAAPAPTLRRRRLSPLIILVLPFLRVGGRRVTLPRRLPLRHEPVNK